MKTKECEGNWMSNYPSGNRGRVSVIFSRILDFQSQFSYILSSGSRWFVVQTKSAFVSADGTPSKCFTTPPYIGVVPQQDMPLFSHGLLNRSSHLKIHVCQTGALLLAVTLQAFIALLLVKCYFYIFPQCVNCYRQISRFIICHYHMHVDFVAVLHLKAHAVINWNRLFIFCVVEWH